MSVLGYKPRESSPTVINYICNVPSIADYMTCICICVFKAINNKKNVKFDNIIIMMYVRNASDSPRQVEISNFYRMRCHIAELLPIYITMLKKLAFYMKKKNRFFNSIKIF